MNLGCKTERGNKSYTGGGERKKGGFGQSWDFTAHRFTINAWSYMEDGGKGSLGVPPGERKQQQQGGSKEIILLLGRKGVLWDRQATWRKRRGVRLHEEGKLGKKDKEDRLVTERSCRRTYLKEKDFAILRDSAKTPKRGACSGDIGDMGENLGKEKAVLFWDLVQMGGLVVLP